jgi:Dolichyl-phosphate-mannose-protein mannosyltransferase
MSEAAVAQPAEPARAEPPSARRGRLWWPLAVAAVVLGALLLRLWGIRWGLPFAYNLDERSHFVPRAVGYFRADTLDPAYQLNPSGLIEWIALALLAFHRSGDAVVRTWQEDPGAIWTVARVASALLATAAVALIYVAGCRLLRVARAAAGDETAPDRWAGLLAALILATAFLPVHYGHLALNDAPSLAFTALALIGVAGVLRTGRLREYALAGAGLGLAVGFKYNAAFLALPLATAALMQACGGAPAPRGRPVRATLLGLLVAGAAALCAFALCDPYALLEPHFFRSQLARLSDYTAGGLLLGETERSGHRYYAWTLLWGFGVVPLALAVVGAGWMVVRERRAALVLIPAVLLFLLVIGSQGRYFARYAMPIYPLLALLAGAGGAWVGRAAGARVPVLRRAAPVAVPLALLLVAGQGLVSSIHNDLVLARTDTRSTARDWMVDHIPAGTYVAVEPIVPKEWFADGARLPDPKSHRGYRWVRFVRSVEDGQRLARLFPGARKPADFANYGFTLFPGYIDYLRERGICWVVSGSMQSGRVFNNPRRVPAAVRYYRALERESDVRYHDAPFPGPDADHYFQYDLAFNFAPLRYDRPGPAIRIHRLRNCTPRVKRSR